MAASVSSVTGTLSQGSEITIAGSGFGTGPTTQLIWDDFEGGADGTTIPASPEVGTWNRNNTTGDTRYSNTQKHSGSLAMRATHSSAEAWQQFNVTFSDSTYLYASFWFWYDAPLATESGQMKLCQVHGYPGTGDFAPGVMLGGFSGTWFASYISYEDNTSDHQQNWYADYPGEWDINGDHPPTRQTWHHFEFIGKQSTPNTANGSIDARINGTSVYTQNNVMTRKNSGSYWNLIEFCVGMTNFTSNNDTYLDDVYVNNTWARVEIGDNATYGNCTRRDIMPTTAWSATSITADFNAGGLADDTTAYLFVVDADGVASSGYEVTIGASGGLLAGPTNLRWRPA